MHYSSFCFHTRQKTWVYLDDSHVREVSADIFGLFSVSCSNIVLQVGKKWSAVVEDCRKAHYQPLLLVYASPNSVPVARETAMTMTFTVPYVNFRSKNADLSPRSTPPIGRRNDEQESKSAVQSSGENQTMVSAPLHQEDLRNVKDSDHSGSPFTESSSSMITVWYCFCLFTTVVVKQATGRLSSVTPNG